MQNNGHFSEKIAIERSVHQGGCLSGTLFNLCVQLLSIRIKNNERIKGLQIGDQTQLLNQYADDTDAFSENDQESLDCLIKELDFFQEQSGLCVSYEKTSIYRIGSLRNSNARLYTAKPLAWTSEGINVLGIYVTYSYESLMEKKLLPNH